MSGREALLVCAFAGVSCGVPSHGPWMYPGQDCLVCHSADSPPSVRAHHDWTVAGTVYDQKGRGLEGAHVIVTDANGRTLNMVTNGVGNFYTAESLDRQRPLNLIAVEYGGRTLIMPWSNGPGVACNSCHTPRGKAGSIISVPGP